MINENVEARGIAKGTKKKLDNYSLRKQLFDGE